MQRGAAADQPDRTSQLRSIPAGSSIEIVLISPLSGAVVEKCAHSPCWGRHRPCEKIAVKPPQHRQHDSDHDRFGRSVQRSAVERRQDASGPQDGGRQQEGPHRQR
ncbi:MAG: hypothetical protein DMF98_21755 [Acidobacteria bacterium]|nr:MAG: hypothetical protein DMF98_21755 [Acidobacteriota bacterium]